MTPDAWWTAFLRVWGRIGRTHWDEAPLKPRPMSFPRGRMPARMVQERWNSFVKSWKKIGNAYKNLTPPPLDLHGREGFVMPDHAPLVPRAIAITTVAPLLIDQAPVDLVARSCGAKKRYPTEDTANAVAIQCWHDRHVWLRAYACEICGGFHLTRSNAPPRMQAGWRPPKISERQQNLQRKRQRR